MVEKRTIRLEKINMVQVFPAVVSRTSIGLGILTFVITYLVLESCCCVAGFPTRNINSRPNVVIRPLVSAPETDERCGFTPVSYPCTFEPQNLRHGLVTGQECSQLDASYPVVPSGAPDDGGRSMEKLARVSGQTGEHAVPEQELMDSSRHESEDGSIVGGEYSIQSRRIDGAENKSRTENVTKRRRLKCLSCKRSRRVRVPSFAVNGSNPEAQLLLAWRAGINDALTHAFASWNITRQPNFCKWKGVGCDNTLSHVVSISMPGKRLAGSIPSGLSGLPFLTTLDLSYNWLSGDLPADLVNISSLKALDLSSNKLTGSVPSFGSNSILESLNLFKNKVAGYIPTSLGECKQLRTLSLGHNRLSGVIPSELGALSNLQELRLEQNYLVNVLPPSLGNCRNLTNLTLAWNELVGGIPLEYSSLTALESLYLQGNNLNGTLPAWLADLPGLSYLQLYDNEFAGPIPQMLGNSTQLISVNFSNNSLNGGIPTALFDSTNLIQLDLSANQLSGLIPQDIGLLTQLQQLRLGQNTLGGSIPDPLRNCQNLTEIVLSGNQLSGSIIGLHNFPHLQRLSLDHNLLNGTIPASLTHCVNLSVVDLSYNSLTGSIPGNISQLTQLTSLGLSGNSLDGSLPDLGGLTNLQFLDLGNNMFNGTIPDTVGNLLQLEVLGLGSNQLSGSIPFKLSSCVNLTTLTLDGNGLSGDIPSSLGQLQLLNVLHLQGNRLTGPIPASFNNFANLQDFDLSENQLTGQIPSSFLAILSQLAGNFSVANNRMSGNLPVQLGMLSMVQNLNLSGNRFDGSIPDAIGNCASLVNLDLSYNSLTGAIPLTIVKLSSLQTLNVAQNALTSSIPAGLGTLESLEHLDLTGNNLSGAIPPALSNLTNLVFLNVSDNSLKGPVPQDGPFRFFSASSFLGNPDLCGPVLQRICNVGSSVPTPGKDTGRQKSSLTKGDRIGISLGAAGFLAVFAVAGFIGWRVAPWRRRHEQRGSIIARSELFYPQLRFKLQDLKLATESFSDVNILGTGSLSTVYRGVLPELVLVAVKKLKISNGVAIPPGFAEELDELAKVRHRHLVAILGHCFDSEVNALVVQYISNGSLEEHLHGRPTCDLDWPARARVGIGVAKALSYLHNECSSTIVHCDLKPSNVLLDADLEPRLEDFGLSRLIFAHKLMEMTDSSVGSSIGYFPPEYGYSPTVSPRGDVYSYGILLLELLTGKKPTADMFNDDKSISQWCQASFPNKIFDVLDPTLIGSKETNSKQVNLFMKVALMCVTEAPDERPTMRSVLEMIR